MKFVCFFVFILGVCHWAKAQQVPNADQVLYRVFYQHEHIRDTTKETIYEEDMVLLIGQSSSLFASYEKIRLRVERKTHAQQEIAMGNTFIRIQPGRMTIPQEYIIRYGQDKVLVMDYLYRFLVYEEEVDPIEWTILTDEKEIEGLKCYKATTRYRGRNWGGWFTPEINYGAGEVPPFCWTAIAQI